MPRAPLEGCAGLRHDDIAHMRRRENAIARGHGDGAARAGRRARDGDKARARVDRDAGARGGQCVDHLAAVGVDRSELHRAAGRRQVHRPGRDREGGRFVTARNDCRRADVARLPDLPRRERPGEVLAASEKPERTAHPAGRVAVLKPDVPARVGGAGRADLERGHLAQRHHTARGRRPRRRHRTGAHLDVAAVEHLDADRAGQARNDRGSTRCRRGCRLIRGCRGGIEGGAHARASPLIVPDSRTPSTSTRTLG